jgi:DNA-binding MarR family transcriptional regulator
VAPISRQVRRALGGAATDRLIHERVRLGIVSALAVEERLTFNELKDLLGITDGNLSAHARKLEEAGYVACTKRFEGRVPRTEYTLEPAGREALRAYLDHMEALIHAVGEGAAGSSES